MGISHSWNGTILTITSDSGTSSADLKGDMGIRGPQGVAGILVDETAEKVLGGYYTKEETDTAISNAIGNLDIPEAEVDLSNYYTKEETDTAISEAIDNLPKGETETVISPNIFDKTAVDTGKVFYHSSSGQSLIDMNTGFCCYVELEGAGVYRFPVDCKIHGETYALRIPLVRSDKTFIRNASATILDNSDTKMTLIEVEITEEDISNGAMYFCYDGDITNIDKLMVVKDIPYPETYIPFGEIEVEADSDKKLYNILYGKTAVFFGDSLGAGSTVGEDSPYYKYGWAGLIGEANSMVWKNYARDGGTIVDLESVDNVRWLSYQTDLAISEYPNADYVIIEGGSNDADIMKDSGLGVISSNYSSFDTTTFTGALESLLKKLIEAYPKSKIGYIVPTKIYARDSYTAENSIQRKYFDRAIEVCNKWGIPVIDLWNSSPLNPKLGTASIFYTDGQHLTLDGYKAIVPQIEAWLRDMYNSGAIGGNSVEVPTKLSEFENDLYYDAYRKPFLEIKPELFTFNENVGVYEYKNAPKIEWLNGLEDIGFEIYIESADEIGTITENDYPISYDETMGLYGLFEETILIFNGYEFNWDTEEATESNTFTIYAWYEDISQLPNFTIVQKVKSKKIPSECIDTTEIDTKVEEAVQAAEDAKVAAESKETIIFDRTFTDGDDFWFYDHEKLKEAYRNRKNIILKVNNVGNDEIDIEGYLLIPLTQVIDYNSFIFTTLILKNGALAAYTFVIDCTNKTINYNLTTL